MLGEAWLTNLGPSWGGGGGHNHSPGPPPPGPSATAQSWGAGRVERRMVQASGSSWGSRRVQLGFPPWVSKNRRLWAPDRRGCRWGGAAVQSSSPAAPLRVRGGGAPGFPLGLRGGRGIPPRSGGGSGRGRSAGSGLVWAARGPPLQSWDPQAQREPRLYAPRRPPPSGSG